MAEIDPQEFGRLQAEVIAMRRDHDEQRATVRHIADQVDSLVALANRSRGALWAGMSVASLAGGVLTYLGEKILK